MNKLSRLYLAMSTLLLLIGHVFYGLARPDIVYSPTIFAEMGLSVAWMPDWLWGSSPSFIHQLAFLLISHVIFGCKLHQRSLLVKFWLVSAILLELAQNNAISGYFDVFDLIALVLASIIFLCITQVIQGTRITYAETAHPPLFMLPIIVLGLITSVGSGSGSGSGSTPPPPPPPPPTHTYYQDSDGDLYGNPAVTQVATSQPAGYVSNNTDCDDASASTNPAATESPNDSIDNNCNGIVDEVVNTYYQDMDADTYGNPDVSQDAASQPAGYVLDNADCNDNDDSINPGAVEVADGIDNNCDGQVDEGFLAITYYQDSDSDGYGNLSVTQFVVIQPSGYVLDNTDCNDSSAAINPAATEISDDNIDNNCDGQVDESAVIATLLLNDTGITFGGNYPSGNNATCIGETINQQDCSHGRDATHNYDFNGSAGFNYTKLNSSGDTLSADAIAWSCVKDNVTGLIWEVKQGGNDIWGDEGLHDADDYYTWYMNTDGNVIGVDNPSTGYFRNISYCSGFFPGTIENLYADMSPPSSYCNAQAYVDRVNTAGLCGATDWRLPIISELFGLVNKSKLSPAIDTFYFPNTKGFMPRVEYGPYWSATPYYGNGQGYVRYLNFGMGESSYDSVGMSFVRLVRSDN